MRTLPQASAFEVHLAQLIQTGMSNHAKINPRTISGATSSDGEAPLLAAKAHKLLRAKPAETHQ